MKNRPPRQLFFIFIIAALLLVACGGATADPATGEAAEPSVTQPPTETPTEELPTSTPVPSPEPTATPTPVSVPTEETEMMEAIEATFVWKIDGGADPLKAPNGLGVDPVGFLYVNDAGNGRVLKFDSEGQLEAIWDEQGSGEGEFNSMGFGGLAVDKQGNVFVVDNGNHRIQKFDDQGNFLTQWGSEGMGDGQFIRSSASLWMGKATFT
jgi:DNA-binding beta-propeller fold protein YncE